jgi:serine O-acetyltransferase
MFDTTFVREDARRLLGDAVPPGGVRLLWQAVRLAWKEPIFFRILVLRHYQWAAKKGWPHLPLRRLADFRLKQYIEIGTLDIGKGLCIYHGDGVVIGEGVRVGDGLTIEHQVTLGNRIGHADDTGYPVIGNNVFIGAGAKVLGGITVGDNARIGANAVVIRDVPPNATAVGIPARVARVAAPAGPAGHEPS